MAAFPCTKCGACCKLAGLVPGFSEPTLSPPSSQCVHLSSQGTCAVYKSRPVECRIINDFALNAKVCNTLQEMTGLPKKFRLPVLDSSYAQA